MKKITFLVIIAIIAFLVGCGQQQPQQQSEAEKAPEISVAEETAPKEASAAETSDAAPGPTPDEPELDESLSKELRDLLTKADNSVSSFKYLAWHPEKERYLDTYFVKGSKIKIKLYEYEPYNIENYFDTVYLDTSAKTAVAKCESTQRCISKNIDKTKETYQAGYYDYLPKETPYTWIKKVKTAEIVGPELYENRRASTKIRYKADDSLVEMWIDDRYGLALKVTITKGGATNTYKYADIGVNSLKDSDVMPPA